MTAASFVHLEPLTLDNWEACSRLNVEESQQGLINGNVFAIARAQFFPEASQRAIYNDAGQMVGFTLYSREPGDGRWKIRHLMIDAAFQRHGYGAQALALVMAEISAKPDGDPILISYRQDNEIARRLYARFGFVELASGDPIKATALWTRDSPILFE